MNKKLLLDYESPTTDVFELRFEGMLCTSPQYGSKGAAGAELDYNDYDSDF